MKKKHSQSAKQSHILFMALLIVAFAVATVFSACGNKGELSQSEQKDFNYYRKAIVDAQDSGKYEKMLILCREFYEQSKQGHSDFFRAYAASDYGQESMLHGNPDDGKKLLDEALELASKCNSDTLMLEVYNGLGLFEQVKYRNYFAAAEYYLKSLEHARRCDKRDLLAVLCNLGSSLSGVNDSTGLKYIQEAYQIAKETGNSKDMMYSAMRMAEQMKMRGNTEEMLKWQQIYIENLPQARRMVSENKTKAENSLVQKEYEEALRYIDIAVAAADTTKNIQLSEKAGVYFVKASILYELGRYKESNLWLDKETELRIKNNNKIRRRTIQQYSRNYEKLGDFAKALEYRKQQVDETEEQANTDRINILKAKEIALDVAEKDAEIEQQRDHARMMEWLFWGALAFIALLAGLCCYIYNMYRQQRRLMTVVVERAQPEKEIEIEEEKENQTDSRHVELFHRIKEEIDDNKMFLDVNLTRESLAEHLGTNRTYITEAVSRMTGMNFPQYINRLRINEAERRLHDPNIDVSNFADFGRTLGFASRNAFRTAFKQQTGMTLSAYREIARNRSATSLSA